MPTRTPDITAAQWLALLTWVAAQIVAWGWLTTLPSQAVLAGGATVLAAAWKYADAHLRGKRAAVAAAAIRNAPRMPPGTPPPGP